MPTYALTGGLGSGKTLSAVGRIVDYLRLGKRVATNLDLDLECLLPARSKVCTVRLSDFPTFDDLITIGRGHYVLEKKSLQKANKFARGFSNRTVKEEVIYSKNEKHNGLLVFDETAVYLNSRQWGDVGRVKVIAWLRHLRKLGWDCIYILQDINSLDKQIRNGMVEHEGVCKRADRLSIPFVGGILRALGLGFLSRPPRIHICSVKYGLSQHSLVVDRWVYRGTTIQNGYDTNQVFHETPVITSKSTSQEVDEWCRHVAIHTVLSPWHTMGRYMERPPFQVVSDFINNVPPPKPYIPLKGKHPLVSKIEKLPVDRRLEFFKRFEAVGAFDRSNSLVCG